MSGLHLSGSRPSPSHECPPVGPRSPLPLRSSLPLPGPGHTCKVTAVACVRGSICGSLVSKAAFTRGAREHSWPMHLCAASEPENGSGPGPVLCSMGLQCPIGYCWQGTHPMQTCSSPGKQGQGKSYKWGPVPTRYRKCSAPPQPGS